MLVCAAGLAVAQPALEDLPDPEPCVTHECSGTELKTR
jgi:hypothetical protein